MKTTTKLLIGLGILVVLSPFGLVLPVLFKAGAAWGEWGAEEIGNMVGYIPKGLARLSTFWNAPLPDYAFKGWEEKGIMHLSLAYIFSAIAGVVLVAALTYIVGKILAKRK